MVSFCILLTFDKYNFKIYKTPDPNPLEMNQQQMDYMSSRISPILEKMCLATLCKKPENIVKYSQVQ